jgi:hypothetical protein
MNSFSLGKLADIHIQSLVDDADEGRTARRATSHWRTPRRRLHFHWHKKSVKQAPDAEQ